MDSRPAVLIAGGSGVIGTTLCEVFSENGYAPRILSRKPSADAHFPEFKWDPAKGSIDMDAFKGCKVVINLAGASLAEKRWTKKRKEVMISSRILSTHCLVEAINSLGERPDVLISASASGYYGNRSEELLTEESSKGSGYMSDLCDEWERATGGLKATVRLVTIRIGIVLSPDGGFVKEMSAPIKYGLGAVLGNGRQYIPWIHVNDLAGMVVHLAKNDSLKGVFNICGPDPVTNRTMTKTIAKLLHRPLWLPPIPELALRIVIGGLTEALLMSSRCIPQRLSDYKFQFNDHVLALRDVMEVK